MTGFMTRLEQQLVAAHRRTLQSQRRRRVATFSVCVVAAVSGTAYAAITAWGPQVGDERRGFPAVVPDGAPPEDQLAMFQALRRPATSDDHSGLAELALQRLPPGVQGIRTGYVRVLRNGGFAGVLIPVERFNVGRREGESTPESLRPLFEEQDDGLCLYFPGNSGSSAGCYTSASLRLGQPAGTQGQTIFGFVPDSVARVRVELDGGETLTLLPENNLFAYTVRRGADQSPLAIRTEWFGGDGELLAEHYIRSAGAP